MSKDRLIQWLAALLAVGAIAGSALLVPTLNAQRRELHLSYDIEIGDRIPPEYALLAAMGSLRGIAVDALWYRAERLKQEGKFHEANTLAELITTLQPRFPTVWIFHAWNLAFNISVETYTPEERWDWVRKGISLLRDQALVYNPTSVLLYKELGFQLLFKLGGNTDEAHWYYKTQWAREWHELLGEPAHGTVEGAFYDDGRPVYRATREFAQIADAADQYFAPERKLDPVTAFEQDRPGVKPLVAALRDADIELNAAGLRRVGRLIALEPYFDLNTLEQRLAPDYPLDHAALDIVRDPDLRARLDALLPLWRAKALIEDYHMKPRKMLEVMQTYGPLDWRHPVAHAAYFSYLGSQMAGEVSNDSPIDVLNTIRGDVHAVQALTESGNVVYNPVDHTLDLLPDPRFVAAYDIAWDRARQYITENPPGGQTVLDTFAGGHENFLLKAMVYAHLYGDQEQARRFFEKASRLYGSREINQRMGRYRTNLEDMILSEYARDWSQPKVANAFVDGQVQQAILQGLRNNRLDVFNRFIDLARRGYERYQRETGYRSIVSGRGRQDLGDSWQDRLTDVYVNVMRSPSLPIIERARIWRNTPLPLQQSSYASFRPQVTEQLAAAGPDVPPFERFFPAPPNYTPPTVPESEGSVPAEGYIEDLERQ